MTTKKNTNKTKKSNVKNISNAQTNTGNNKVVIGLVIAIFVLVGTFLVYKSFASSNTEVGTESSFKGDPYVCRRWVTVPTPGSKISKLPTLRKGDSGECVVHLQYMLDWKLPGDFKVDGIFGSATENAVKKFQSAKGLEVDGVVGQKTWQFLN